MIILKNALVLSYNKNNTFGRYSILINENRITDMAESGSKAGYDKLKKWLEMYSNQAEVVDSSRKLIMPPFVNPCVKSEGLALHYLLKQRHYESKEADLCTDLIFNYLYQEMPGEETLADLQNIYNYSFYRQLKSGTTRFNEFSLRKDINHFQPIQNMIKKSQLQVSVCFPAAQDVNTLRDYKYLNPSFYLTQENHLTVYDISNITELKNNYVSRLYLEVATNKGVTEKFHLTFQKSVIALLNEYGLLDESTSLINPIYLSYDDLKIIADKGANIIVCPRDLVQFSDKYFPIDDFISHGIRFSIGTGWLGEDIFKDVRLFRNRYRDLNLTSAELLNAITKFPNEMFFHPDADERSYSVDINRKADMVFVDLTDIRFQFFPESSGFMHISDFLLDNLTINNISDVIINGEFKVKERKLVGVDEDAIIAGIEETRQRLYKVGKYEELQSKKERRLKVEELDLSARDEDEVRLFSNVESQPIEFIPKEEFKVKIKASISRPKPVPGQRTLFEEPEQTSVIQIYEYKETPELNLLVTEFSDSKTVEEEVVQVKAVDESILMRLGTAVKKPPEKQKSVVSESKVELPKDVRLKFGDE